MSNESIPEFMPVTEPEPVPPPPEALAEAAELSAPPLRPAQEVVDEVVRMAGPCAVFTHSMTLGRAIAYDRNLTARPLKAAFFFAWNRDPRVSVVEITREGDRIYEITYTQEDRQNLDAVLKLHQDILSRLGGPDRLYRGDLSDALREINERAQSMLPADISLPSSTMFQIIRSRTIGEYEIYKRAQGRLSPAAGAIPPNGTKRRDPSKEVPPDFDLPYLEATCEELRGIPWRLDADGEPAYETVGSAIDSFVERRSDIISLHWHAWIMSQIIGMQSVTGDTTNALATCIFRDNRFTLLGANTFGNTLHRLEPLAAQDIDAVWEHEMLAQRIVDFLRNNRLRGSHPYQKLAKATLEVLNIRVYDWDLRYLGWLMQVQKDVVSYSSSKDNADVHLRIRLEQRQQRVRRRGKTTDQ